MGEYDRIVEIFTEDLGRIDGIAKGARSFKNRFGAHLSPSLTAGWASSGNVMVRYIA